MKRILYTLASVACAAMAFTSCSNDDAMEGNVPEPVMQIAIEAGTPEVEAETRTELNGTIPMWSVGDKIGVMTQDNSFKTLTSSATAASKTTTFTGTVPMGTTTLYPFYPSANQGVNTDKNIKMDIPALQYPTETSFDGAADMLIGKPIAVTDGVDVATLKTQFARVIGVLKVNVKGAINGEKLESLSVSVDKSEAAGFAGRVSLDVRNSMGLTSLYYNKSLKVSAEYASENQFALNGTNGAYLCVYPQTLAAGTILTISGTTAGHNFKKVITLKNPIEILPGKLTNLNVTLNAEHISIRTSGAVLPFVDDFSWLHTGKVSIDSSKGKYTNGTNLYCDNLKELRIGVSKHGGSIETKFLNLSKPYTIKVTANAYGSDNSKLVITVGSVTKTETLTATAQEYVIPMPAATENEKIKFATENAGGRRVCIQRIEVLDGQGGEVVEPSIINVTTTSPIAMGWIGGMGEINYTIENPKQGVTIAAESNQPWVNGFTCTDSMVKFNVDENTTGVLRTATITLTYGIITKTVEITQVAAGTSAENTMTIDLTNKGYGNSVAVATVAGTEPLSVVFTGAKFYDKGNAVRMYNGNKLTIGGKTITKVVFTVSSKGKKPMTCGAQTIDAKCNWTWENPAGVPEVVFTGTATHTGIQKITVTYK